MKYDIENLTSYIKDLNTKEYADSFLGTTFGDKKTSSCPVCNSNDNMTYSPSKNIIKCHGCSVGGNIIDSTMKLKKIEFIPALKDIASNLNLDTTLDDDVTTAETVEEAQERQRLFKEQQAKRESKKLEDEKIDKDAKQKASIDMAKKAPIYSQELDDNYFNYHNKIDALYPKFENLSEEFRLQYLGYDTTHDTPVIINRDCQNNVYNLKHRQKFVWDKREREHTDTRTTGKWISYFNSTTRVFPYDNYLSMSQENDTVVITEGEKDCINLITLGINAITLGGVANSWNNHKEILKDKTVYIFFDNDNAGYENSIKAYNELNDIAKDVYVVLFFQIDSTLPKNYDISDFIKAKDFKNKDQLFHSIAYSSFKLTTSVIQDIENFTSLDLSEYYFNQATTLFPDIKKAWVDEFDKSNNAKLTARGEKDIANLDDFMDGFKKLKNTSDFKSDTKLALLDRFLEQDLYKSLSHEKKKEKVEDLSDTMIAVISNYEKIYKEYRQTHLVDMYLAFETLTRKTGFTLAKYDDMLAVWTGTHYHVIEDRLEDFSGFLLRDWMKLAKIDMKKWTKRNVDEVIENLHMKSDSLNSIHHYQKDKRVVNFTNGTLFISNKNKQTFIPHHDKKHGVMNMLEFDYNPSATCPKWEKFLAKVLPNEDDRATLMQFIGYCFFPGHDYEAYLFLYGKSGANGKSVILDVLRQFFGDENISNLNIQQFVGHELHGLANKLINIGSELDAKGLNDGQMGVLKALTSTNDAVQINPKFTKGYPLASRHQPKLINSGNAKPNPKVMDDGVYRRTLLLEFDYEIKDDEKIRDLSSRFQDELSGIMALALKALDTLVKNGKFTKSERLLGSIEEYKDQTNPIRAFVKENLEEDEGIIIPKKLFYAFYKSWCEEKGLYVSSEPKFFQQIHENIKSCKDRKQIRVPIQHELVEILGTERPSWIQGIFIKSQDFISFIYKTKEVLTSSLNRDTKTKQVIIKEDESRLRSGN